MRTVARSPLALATLLAAAVGALVLVLATPAEADEDRGDADVLVFWGEGCPTSATAMDWLDDFDAAHPDVAVERVEVWEDDGGAARFERVMEGLDRQPRRVPTFVTDGQVRIGFSPAVTEWLESTVADEDGVADDALPPPGEIEDEALEGVASDEADPAEILGALRAAWWLAAATGVATILVAALALAVWWQRRRAQAPPAEPPPGRAPG